MINSVSLPLDNILGLLRPLSSSNKKWIADRLYEEISLTKDHFSYFCDRGENSKEKKNIPFGVGRFITVLLISNNNTEI